MLRPDPPRLEPDNNDGMRRESGSDRPKLNDTTKQLMAEHCDRKIIKSEAISM